MLERLDAMSRFLLIAGALCAAIIVVFGVGVLIALPGWFVALDGESVCLVLTAGPVLVGVGSFLLKTVVSWGMGKADVGPVEVLTARRRFTPGEQVEVRVVFTPRVDLSLLRAEAHLVLRDEAGDSSDVVQRERCTLSVPAVARANERVVLAGRPCVPLAPLALSADPGDPAGDRYRWTVEVVLEAGAWRRVEERYPIEVRADADGAPLRALPEPTPEATRRHNTHLLRPLERFPAAPSDLQVVGTVEVEVQPHQVCPFCRDDLAGADPADLLTCAGCRAVFHRACAHEAASCTTAGCRNNRRARDATGP